MAVGWSYHWLGAKLFALVELIEIGLTIFIVIFLFILTAPIWGPIALYKLWR